MKKIAGELGVKFDVIPSCYEEDMEAHGDPRKLARVLALGKAMEVAERISGRGRLVVIGADTFILCGGKKIGKPSSVRDAKRIIRSMSGRMIEVWSGVAVVVIENKFAGMDARIKARRVRNVKIAARRVRSICTRLWVKRMSEGEVDLLAWQDGALQKSGAFGIEGIGGTMITRREGDFDNVVGLPVNTLRSLLKRLSIDIN